MATIHTFTGNEVIATEVPKYLNDNFSALNTETANLSKSVVKTVNGTLPVNGNVNIVGFDSYWEANEQVSVGDIRVPKGRENSGLFFECVKAGTTGSSQPEVDTAILADFSDVGRIGQVRWIYNIAEKDDDEIFATGVKYSRATYSALWEYVQSKPALLISEIEWQAKYEETGGKFVPYYSEGDGSTDFRTPLLAAYATGVTDNSKIGTFKADSSASVADLIANHYHGYGHNNGNNAGSFLAVNSSMSFPLRASSGNRGWNGSGGGGGYSGDQTSYSGNLITSMPIAVSGITASTSSLNPDTMYGVWVIKAFGLIVNAENTDVKNVLTNIQTTNQKISNFETNYDFVVESWRDGTSWYRKYKSGWVEQGGSISSQGTNSTKTVTFLKPFKDGNFYLNGAAVYTANSADDHRENPNEFESCSTTGFVKYYYTNYVTWYWKAEGMGA